MRAGILTASSLLWLACVWVACADGSTAPRAERCAPLAELAPLASQECRESEEAIAFTDALQSVVEDSAYGMLVRTELDDGSRARTICADGAPNRREWKERLTLGSRLVDLVQMPPGPVCLAGKRVDLNRRAAKLAEVDETEFRCANHVRVTRDAERGHATPRFLDRALTNCIQHEATWVLLYETGVMQPLVFAKPEVVDPPPVPARDTVSRCGRVHVFEKRVACVEAEGWERLR